MGRPDAEALPVSSFSSSASAVAIAEIAASAADETVPSSENPPLRSRAARRIDILSSEENVRLGMPFLLFPPLQHFPPPPRAEDDGVEIFSTSASIPAITTSLVNSRGAAVLAHSIISTSHTDTARTISSETVASASDGR